jgi:hypothetical protein
MYKMLSLLAVIVLTVSINSNAQKTASDLKIAKFGKVTAADFETKPFGADSSAAAVKIFDSGKITFEVSTATGSLESVFERHVRYKIINKNAYDLANLELHLYRGSNGGEEKLGFATGATYNMVDGKVVVSKMNSDAKFTSQLDKNYTIKKLTLPNVKEGSVIEFNYETKSPYIFKIDDWYFQSGYPCKLSYLSFTMPQYYNYKLDATGYINIIPMKPVQVSQSLYIPSTNTTNSGTVTAQAMRNDYYAENIPAIKEENFITTMEDYVGKMGFELSSSNFPNSGFKDYGSTWQKIVEELMEHENFGGFIKRDSYSRDMVQGIISTETDPQRKMNLIFDYVKKNIKWDGKYSDYTKATSHKAVLEKKSGNAAEINLILMGMLNNAGLTAYPVLISTRRNGTHPGYPLIAKFNNVIVLVEMADSVKHFLDATDKNNVEDMIGYQNLNHMGLKVDVGNRNASWISTEDHMTSRSSMTYNLKLDKENKMTGSLYISSTHYNGLARRQEYQNAASEAEFLKDYKSSKPGLEISNYKIRNLDQPLETLEETMDITIEDNIEETGDVAYFMPMLFERTKENPFRLEERNFPVDFAYPTEENYRIMIELPETYKLEKLPASQKFALPNNDGSFTIIYDQAGNKIAIRSKITINKSTFTADEYFNLKELFKNIVAKQAEQIVFKKS